jgi:crotonobetainyl-CoA:carnitine CoA-transferase CaiB-like acyl-CoA transferase
MCSELPWEIRRPAPLLGQHNEEVYSSLGYSKEDLVKLREGEVI